MPKYLIERTISGANQFPSEKLQAIAEGSICAMEHLPGYIWHESFVAGDKFYCVHEAADEKAIREHSRRGGFPIDRVTEIAAVVTPATAQAPVESDRSSRRSKIRANAD
jgi:hypothetical protein